MMISSIIILISYLINYVQNILNAIELIDYPFISNGPQVNQVLSKDSKSMLVFIGTKSFSFNNKTTIYNPNQFDSKPSLSINPSTSIKRINSDIIAIVCGEKHLAFVDETGSEIASYTSVDSYDNQGKCSIIQLALNSYLLGFYDTNLSQINLEKITYDPSLKQFTFVSVETIPSTISFIQCNFIDSINLQLCIYIDSNNVHLKWLVVNRNLTVENLDYTPVNDFPQIVAIDPKFYLFTPNVNIITGHTLEWDTDNNVLITDTTYKELTLPPTITSWKITSITQLYGDGTGSNSNIEVFLLVYCYEMNCSVQKIESNFNNYQGVISITIPSTDVTDINTMVSLAVMNNLVFSLIITQTNTNWLYLYTYLSCSQMTDVKGHTIPFLLLTKVPTLEKYRILFNNKNDMKYVSLNTGQKAIEKEWYSFPIVQMVFPIQIKISFRYQLQNEENQIADGCDVEMTICNSLCSTCFEYGPDLDNMKCSKCKNPFYLSYAKTGNCIEKSTCINIVGYVLEEEPWKCVKSCTALNYLIDVDDYKCVTECKTEHTLNKIASECLTQEKFEERMEYYVSNIDTYIKPLYLHYPLRITNSYGLSIYNTSILPENHTLEVINNGTPYDIIYLSSVDLGECELYLKEKYDLNLSQPLLIAKFDTVSNKQISNVVDFKVYSLAGKLLDISICYNDNKNIIITTPINAHDNEDFLIAQKYHTKDINAFNSSDDFFNNLCYPYTTEYLTDIPLPDRVEDILLDDIILCNTGCNYVNIDYQKKSVTCSCSKEAVHLYKENYNTLMKSFSSFWTSSNLAVVKCYNLVFAEKKFSNNLGSWFMLLLILIELISALYFFVFGYKDIQSTLLKIVPNKKQTKKEHDLEILCIKKEINPKDSIQICTNFNEATVQNKDKPQEKTPINKLNINQQNILGSSQQNSPTADPKKNAGMILLKNTLQSKTNFFEPIENKNSQLNANNKSEQNLIDNPLPRNKAKGKTINFNIIPSNHKEMSLKLKNECSQIHDEIDEEDEYQDRKAQTQIRSAKKAKSHMVHKAINYLNEYEENPELIIKFNTENFIFFYWTFLQHVHLLIRSFFAIDKHKTRGVTISMFFFCISLSFTLNALFFSDKYVSKSYTTQGDLNFLFNFPKMIYSFLLSYLFKLIFNMLSSIASVITSFTQKNEHDKKKVIIHRLRWKLSMFYCLKFIFLAFFWYYVAAFCAVYPNIQMTWIISSLTSFVLDMLVPFAIAGGLTIVLMISTRFKIAFLTKLTNNFIVH